jgi:hypothetical protein
MSGVLCSGELRPMLTELTAGVYSAEKRKFTRDEYLILGHDVVESATKDKLDIDSVIQNVFGIIPDTASQEAFMEGVNL